MAKLMETELDRSKPLWRVYVKEDYDKNTSVIFFIFDHLVADGMGIISLISQLNDKHGKDLIIQQRQIPFLFNYIIPLLYIPVGLVRIILIGLTYKKDSKMTPLACKNIKQSVHKVYLESR